MSRDLRLRPADRPWIVGCPGDAAALRGLDAARLDAACDFVEIRLDLPGILAADWSALHAFPKGYTARSASEGGVRPLSAAERTALLREVLEVADWIDLEVAELDAMAPLVGMLRARNLPWIGSFHDFSKLPDDARLDHAARLARDAGAAVFKLAAWLQNPEDLARLARFQSRDHGIPVATMGMGPLGPVSRLLCAQFGSHLAYGRLGATPTAPGQWDAVLLKQAVGALEPVATNPIDPPAPR
ncbi:MAG: type I 3-dehydroquinate dehydratase [Verrucomicrobia bacterium]|nr:type I 3-dehydroquinate dehydratase [Verrucomicrobiota bacterium]